MFELETAKTCRTVASELSDVSKLCFLPDFGKRLFLVSHRLDIWIVLKYFNTTQCKTLYWIQEKLRLLANQKMTPLNINTFVCLFVLFVILPLPFCSNLAMEPNHVLNQAVCFCCRVGHFDMRVNENWLASRASP